MSTGEVSKNVFQRLPQDVIPFLYQITLKPDLTDCIFSGSESIHVQVNKQTNLIILNAADLEINKATFQQNNIKDELVGSIWIDQPNEKVTIQFDKALELGDGILNLTFNGVLNDKMVGFYRSRYISASSGEQVYAAVTQFAATDARRAFPCWDEPAIKAEFELTVVAPIDRIVLSNTLVTSEKIDEENNELKVVSFKRTPKMSTYLFAAVISHYDVLEGHTKRGTLVRVFTPVGKSLQGTYSLDCALRALEWLEDYFNIPYPLEKLDHVPIADFAYHAMENWGLITYREVALLVDPANTSMAAKQNIAQCISHETSHQWFGNLVTMEWWTHLWLNEGFASFMQYLVVEALYPEYEYWKQFCIDASVPALGLDASHKSHPIEVPVNAPEEIISIFDEISYQKGASIIRMCHNWIGDEVFRSGMSKYLTENAYKNTITQDLWRSLEKASGKPVQKMMSSWTEKMGYPLITVAVSSQNNTTCLTLKQEKFSIDGKLSSLEENDLWMIPISLVSSNNPQATEHFNLMDSKTMQVTLDQLEKNSWIKLNPALFGFYRVNYPYEMWFALGEAVKTKTLCPEDRLQIIDDLSALNYAGKAPIDLLFKMLQNYSNEDDYVPWNGVYRCLMRLNRLIAYTGLEKNFKIFGQTLLSRIYEKLGFDAKPGEPNITSLMRSQVLCLLTDFEYEPVLNEAKKRFELHCSGSSTITPDLRSMIYQAVANRDNETFDTLFKLHNEIDLQEEKLRIACSLSHTDKEDRILRVLDFAFSNHVRSQDAWQVILSAASNLKGRTLVWEFYKKNVDEIKKKYGSHRSSARLISITENFATEEMAKEVETFFQQHPFPGLDDVIYRATEKIRTNQAWLERESDLLIKYFSVKTSAV